MMIELARTWAIQASSSYILNTINRLWFFLLQNAESPAAGTSLPPRPIDKTLHAPYRHIVNPIEDREQQTLAAGEQQQGIAGGGRIQKRTTLETVRWRLMNSVLRYAEGEAILLRVGAYFSWRIIYNIRGARESSSAACRRFSSSCESFRREPHTRRRGEKRAKWFVQFLQCLLLAENEPEGLRLKEARENLRVDELFLSELAV